ncbi:hypothetical protein FRB97_001779 [Tulasnella sp. 331]|nr:hypothetical protein FRB97_001779 [Tulasnella sp. 331]KAG8883278.1 hypothetical protein FRB98_003186 [Tulasnella sp. 332]
MVEAFSSTGSSSKAVAQPLITTSAPAVDVEELDKLLAQEESAFQRDLEVERILKAFKLNPYAVLELTPKATESEIKKRYRTLSLFIHPDKASHPRASEAFDLLKKAESDLSDQSKREELDSVYIQARALVLKSLTLPLTVDDDDSRLTALQPGFQERLQQQTKELLIDEEVRRRKAMKMNLANEGLEAKKKEEEANKRKRKVEEDKQWEETREQRVGSWRNFQSGNKKKKTKANVLG